MIAGDWHEVKRENTLNSQPIQEKMEIITGEPGSHCDICGANLVTRLGACWCCAEAESIIADGTDMYDKGPDGSKVPAKSAMEKLQFLIQKGWKT